MEFEFSGQIFDKNSRIKFQNNPSSGNRNVPRGLTDRLTDRHDEGNSRFPQCCERCLKISQYFNYVIFCKKELNRIVAFEMLHPITYIHMLRNN
jgi:hypothetical protein